jgi:hypothetical protein
VLSMGSSVSAQALEQHTILYALRKEPDDPHGPSNE